MDTLSKKLNVSEEKLKNFSTLVINNCSRHPKKNSLVIYDDLIKRTYESLGFNISLEEIHEQAGNLFGVIMILSSFIGNKMHMSEELASKIEEKSDELTDLCISNFKYLSD